MEILERLIKEVRIATEEYKYQVGWSRANHGRCNRCTPIARLYLEIAVAEYVAERRRIYR